MGIQEALSKIQVALAKISPDFNVEVVNKIGCGRDQSFLKIKYTIENTAPKEKELPRQQHVFGFIADVFRDTFQHEVLDIRQEEGQYTLTYETMSEIEKNFLENLPEDFFERLFIKAMEWAALDSSALQSQLPQSSQNALRNVYESNTELLKNIAIIEQNVVATPEILSVGSKKVSEISREVSKIFFVNGLPTIVMAKIKEGADFFLEQTLCDTIFPELLPLHTMFLSRGGKPQNVLNDLLEKINNKAQQLDKGKFSFSCAVSYKDVTGCFKLAYLSVGDDQLILTKEDGERVFLGNEGNASNISLDSGTSSVQYLPVLNVKDLPNVKMVTEDIAIGHRISVENNKTEPVTSEGSELADKDSLIASATIPDDKKQQAINRECYTLHCKKNPATTQAHALAQHKQKVIDMLEQQYSWRPRMFGHHHHDRRVALCKAIGEAKTMQQIQLTLANQASLTQSATSVQPINKTCLFSRWASSDHLKNKIPAGSGYLKAVQEAQKISALAPL